MTKRLLHVLRIYLIALVVLIAYAVFTAHTGLGIPCIFRLITRFNCPGCGISRFCLECLQFRFLKALSYNYASPFIVAYVAWVVIYTSVSYIRTGSRSLNPRPAWINIVFLIGLILWGIVRNILGI